MKAKVALIEAHPGRRLPELGLCAVEEHHPPERASSRRSAVAATWAFTCPTA
ncbi:MAG: hypothetical protein R2856_37635 [Caldilineaceae bacterium]